MALFILDGVSCSIEVQAYLKESPRKNLKHPVAGVLWDSCFLSLLQERMPHYRPSHPAALGVVGRVGSKPFDFPLGAFAIHIAQRLHNGQTRGPDT